MIDPEQFHFLRPYWLPAFVPLVVIVWLMLKRKLGSKTWESVCDRELLPYILIGNTAGSGRFIVFMLALSGTLAILALAGPVWEKLPQPVFSTQSDLVIALDLSKSMDATDITPSRVARARFKITDILARRAEGETALLVYAGDTFAVTPLTDDTATIESQLGALTTNIMPVQGSRTDIAITKAVELLKQAGAGKGDILLITDEVDLRRAEATVREISNRGYRLSIMGVGTPEGAPIVLADGSFLKDESGEIVVPTLNEGPMRQLADIGGGRYIKLSIDDRDINSLDEFFTTNFSDDDVSETEFETDVWHEQGPWLVVLLLPFAAMVFRRGYLVVLLMVIGLPYPEPLHAFDWESLWSRSDQRGKQAFDAGDPASAAELFTDPAWKGAAHYRAGNFEDALRYMGELQGTENYYNLGNALARNSLYEEAITAYEMVLSENPDHEDAKFNKELLEKILEEQENQQAQQQQQEQDQEQQQQEQQEQQQNPGEQQMEDMGGQAQTQQAPQQQVPDEEKSSDLAEKRPQDDQSAQEQEPDNLQASLEMQANEEKQATEQWLRRIPDDPGGLLRRKFLYQYQQRQHNDIMPGEKTW